MKGDGRNKISLLLPNESRIVGLPSREMTVRGFSAVSLLIIDEAARVPDMMFGESSHSSGYGVPKRDLITGLQVLFESRKFEMPDTPATEDLIHELAGMRAKPSRTGNWRYEGSPDDLVLSLALAWWWARKRVTWNWPQGPIL